jgi:hypothetical protein
VSAERLKAAGNAQLTAGRTAEAVAAYGAALAACLDEGILPLSLPHSRLYGEFL